MYIELYDKVKDAKTPEELIKIARENGREISEKQAEEAMKWLGDKKGELTDEEITNASGGGGCDTPTSFDKPCPICNQKNEVDGYYTVYPHNVDESNLAGSEDLGVGAAFFCKNCAHSYVYLANRGRTYAVHPLGRDGKNSWAKLWDPEYSKVC